MNTKPPHIAIVVDNAYASRQGLIRGILRFSKLHGPWAINIVSGRSGDANLKAIEKWTCDGLITNVLTPKLARFARQLQIPTLQLSTISPPRETTVTVQCDNKTIAHTAANHLLGKGFKSFAYIGDPAQTIWSRDRGIAFRQYLRKRRFGCPSFEQENPSDDDLSAFLLSLPKPTAVFVAFDLLARRILDLVLALGLNVPRDLAILGVDNEEIICETSSPTISSIPLSLESAGFAAAKALNAALGHPLKKAVSVCYTGIDVVERESTQFIRCADWLVERCLELIRANPSVALRVADLLSKLNVSRRTLETRFKAATGMTVAQALFTVRLNHARTLLSESSLTQEDIAARCGFCDASHMSRLFRTWFGKPPSSFRRTDLQPPAANKR